MTIALARDVAEVVGDSRDREAWLRIRGAGVGASEAAIVVGESRRRTAGALWAAKRALLEPTDLELDDEGDSPEWLEWGLRHEPTILAAYGSDRYAGRISVSEGKLLRSKAHPWALATLDAWTLHPVHGWIPLELKTSEVWRADEWANGCPLEYEWQLTQQMLVTGRPAASIACLLGVHRLVWADVERDPMRIDRLVRAGERFWRYVETGEVPPGPLDSRSLGAIYPRDNGDTIELPGALIALDEEREGLSERRRVIERRIDEIDGELRGAIGAYSLGLLPNGAAYTLRANKNGTRSLRRRAPKEAT